MEWPKREYKWIEGRTLYVSIPFTWNLPDVRGYLLQRSFEWDTAVVGGPALDLMPDFFADLEHVAVRKEFPGILQRINPLATRTTTGCTRTCGFCGIGTGKIEPGGLVELKDWPNLPVLCDNNLLAASQAHFDKVCDRLEKWGWADFNQGLDSRLLTPYHAERLKRIGKPKVRLALDHMAYADQWENAFSILRAAGVAKSCITSYAIIGFNTDPDEAWRRCEWISNHGILAYPMWYHTLDALEYNAVTSKQRELGWTDEDRTHIMGYYYKRRGEPRCLASAPS